MIDEAHSIGVLGASGRGLTEYFGIDRSQIDLIVGTLSKAFLSCGGFVAGKSEIIEWLRYTLPGHVYSVGISPANAAVARCAIQILRKEKIRLAQVDENSKYFLRRAKSLDLNVGSAIGSAVIPIRFPDIEATIDAANTALRCGHYVPPIVQIAVPTDAPRLRFFVTAAHTKSQIDGVLQSLVPSENRRTADLELSATS